MIITKPERQVLEALADYNKLCGSPSASALAGVMGVSRATVWRHLAQLRVHGMVECRSKHYGLTKKGLAAIQTKGDDNDQ